MRHSLEALRRWDDAGLHTGVSVNLPVISAEDDRYSRLVSELLSTYDVAPGRLTLELLETGFADRSLHHRRRSLDHFTSLGVRLAQDDLGSGYSSLLRLRHFDFDDVKLDQSLLRGTDKSAGAALRFIKPINAIARSLGLSVVLEGLEDDGLIEVGVQLDVDQGQGYGSRGRCRRLTSRAGSTATASTSTRPPPVRPWVPSPGTSPGSTGPPGSGSTWARTSWPAWAPAR